MRIYIAGPMTGLPEYNLPAFAKAATALRAVGYTSIDPGRRGVIEGYTWSDYLRLALTDLLTCEAVAVLPGWENSNGAKLEVYVSQQLGMPVEPLTTWLERVA